jgi:hypothetical protein
VHSGCGGEGLAAVPIVLEAQGARIFAVLNRTVAAQDFLQRLPLSACGCRRDGAYRCSVAIGRFDPLETQRGWQAGDVCLDGGQLSLRQDACPAQEAPGSTMVIGRIDRVSLPLLERLSDQVRFSFRVAQTLTETERNAS